MMKKILNIIALMVILCGCLQTKEIGLSKIQRGNLYIIGENERVFGD